MEDSTRAGFLESSSDHGGLLKELIKYNRCKTVVEIGVAYGTTTKYLCEGLLESDRWGERVGEGKGIVYGFDIWSTHGRKISFPQLGSLEVAEQYLKESGLSNFKLCKIDTTSVEFSEKIKSISPIDFVFIDGDHSYAGVKNDFECVYPHLTASGIIVFHDTFMCDGSREFILELRTSRFDGTFDITSTPWGNRHYKFGLSILFKRYDASKLPGPGEMCGSNFSPSEITKRESEWLAAQVKK